MNRTSTASTAADIDVMGMAHDSVTCAPSLRSITLRINRPTSTSNSSKGYMARLGVSMVKASVNIASRERPSPSVGVIRIFSRYTQIPTKMLTESSVEMDWELSNTKSESLNTSNPQERRPRNSR
jgi:hypothetical protein